MKLDYSQLFNQTPFNEPETKGYLVFEAKKKILASTTTITVMNTDL